MRLIERLRDFYPEYTEKVLTGLCMAGEVFVNDVVKTSPAYKLKKSDQVRIRKLPKRFVSRGGEKLSGALKHFDVAVEGKTCLDIGVSTGGFTDCLLQAGAVHVVGVDVSYGLTDVKIRDDVRVTLIERKNVRFLEASEIGSEVLNAVSLVVMDLSFISMTKVLPTLLKLVPSCCEFLVLMKPQFEAPKSWIEDGGLITDSGKLAELHASLKEALRDSFEFLGESLSCIKGTKGNQEYFYYLKSR